MGKVKRVLRCYHCGAVLQSRSKKEKGFIAASFLNDEKAEQQVLYCSACYEKMKAINNGFLEADADDEILKILNDAVASDALIIWVLDLFSFNGTLNPDIVKKIKNLKICVIGNKFDLFPKKIKVESMVEYLKERFEEVGITPFSIKIFKNSEDLEGDKMINDLHQARQGHDVYMIGSLASGKTSIINKGMKYYVNKSKRVIKTENYPGTSVNVLEIPLSNSSFLYELPGFSLVNSVAGKVEKDVQRMITPKSEIKVTGKTLDVDESLMIGSLAAVTLIKGKPTAFKFYSAEMVEAKKVSNKHLEAELKNNSIKKGLRPVSERYTDFTDYDLFDYTMENDGKMHDIAISGLGWVSFEARGQVIRILAPRGTALKECLSKVR